MKALLAILLIAIATASGQNNQPATTGLPSPVLTGPLSPSNYFTCNANYLNVPFQQLNGSIGIPWQCEQVNGTYAWMGTSTSVVQGRPVLPNTTVRPGRPLVSVKCAPPLDCVQESPSNGPISGVSADGAVSGSTPTGYIHQVQIGSVLAAFYNQPIMNDSALATGTLVNGVASSIFHDDSGTPNSYTVAQGYGGKVLATVNPDGTALNCSLVQATYNYNDYSSGRFRKFNSMELYRSKYISSRCS
jgi:hypothetical protein